MVMNKRSGRACLAETAGVGSGGGMLLTHSTAGSLGDRALPPGRQKIFELFDRGIKTVDGAAIIGLAEF